MSHPARQATDRQHQPPKSPTARSPEPPPADRSVRRPVAVAIIVAAVIVGIMVVGVAIRLDADRLPTGPPLPPPSPTPVGLQYDQGSREASYENVEVTLAGSPYLCATEPEPMGPFDDAVPCSFTVHEFYSGSHSWQAETGFALVPDSLSVSGDTQASAKAIFDRLLQDAYPKDAKVSKLEVGPNATLGDAAVLSARINVAIPKLPTTYDSAVVVVLTAEDGQQVSFYSLKPNDAGADALKAVQASASTLTTTR
jgi:hypothetical protein